MGVGGHSSKIDYQALASRRAFSRTLAGAGTIVLHQGLSALHGSPIGAQSDDEDSGRGRGRGRGRSGDHNSHAEEGDDTEQDSAVEVTGLVPASSIEIRIVSDDAGGFVPGDLTVDLGQVVTFINGHDDEHTATGSGFDTGVIEPGSTATIALETAGVFFYACQFHPEMTGSIRVRDANGTVLDQTSVDLPQGATEITIANLTFEPAQTTIEPGTTVVWTNADTVPHTVTSTSGAFDSGIFDPGAAFSWTFETAGSFDYTCQLHPQMSGTIVVSSGANANLDSGTAASPIAEPGEQPAMIIPDESILGPWMMELVPDEAMNLSESRALFTFHQDGTLNAEFILAGEQFPATGQIGPAQGNWDLRGEQVHVALAVLILDASGAFGGLTLVEGDLELDADLGSVTGVITFTDTSPSGATTDGEVILRGLRIPLGA